MNISDIPTNPPSDRVPSVIWMFSAISPHFDCEPVQTMKDTVSAYLNIQLRVPGTEGGSIALCACV